MPKTTTAKKTTKKTTTARKRTTNRSTKPVANQKVDYYPNRMSFYISLLAVCILMLLALITAL